MNPTNENQAKGHPDSTERVEKRGVVDENTPFLLEQDDLDAVEKTACATLAPPRRSA
jgi:hypothetical protein